MKKITMLTYLDDRITKVMPEYDLALDWDPKNHSIEVLFRLFAENKERAQFDDVSGVASEEEIIEFEDSILLYNPEKTKLNPEDYLTVIPYAGKKGISKAILDAVVDYLKKVIDEGQNNLLNFLTDDTQEVFELNWSNEQFKLLVEKYTNKEKDRVIPYPSY